MTRENREKTPSPTGNKRAPKNLTVSLQNHIKAINELYANARSRIHTFENVPTIYWEPKPKTTPRMVHSGVLHPPLVNRVRPMSARAKRGLKVTKNPKNANNETLQALRMKLRNTNLPNGVSLENVQKIRYVLKSFNMQKMNENNKKKIIKTVGVLRIPLTNYGTLNIIKVFAILKKKHLSNFKNSREKFNNSLKN